MITVESGFPSGIKGQGLNLSGADALVRYGPTVRVHIDHILTELISDNKLEENDMVFGLVDTGALHSCIDIDLATKLKLPSIDKIHLSGATGSNEHNVYLARIFIPDLQYKEFGEFAGVDLAGGNQIHRALLGRTFLKGLMMNYTGMTGHVPIVKPS